MHGQTMNQKEKEILGIEVVYGVDDVPKWYLCIFLGFQHFLTMFAGFTSVPFILAPALCIAENDVARGTLLCNVIFVCGIATFIQSTLGVRLPIVQGTSIAFLLPAFAILNLPKWRCPPEDEIAMMDPANRTELWQSRMREIQGSLMVASIAEILLGYLGIIGILLRYITPLTIAPIITMIGLSLPDVAGNLASKNWAIALFVVLLVVVLSQYMQEVKVPNCLSPSKPGFPFFKVFPMLLAIGISWSLCAILTVTGALPELNPARTDNRNIIITEAPWFRVPYPGQWGIPSVSSSATLGMVAAILASAVESVGDYYACAKQSGAPPPPMHAINRGIGTEGIGCLLAGLWGTGLGLTSISENVAAIGITKVASRRVIQTTALLLILFGVFGKFGAVFVTIPDPIIGGIFCSLFGLIAAIGISNLSMIDLSSSRNLFIFGFSIFFTLVVTRWMAANPDAIDTGSPTLDQILNVLLGTSMLVAGVIGCFLDNTIPGSDEERGMIIWRAMMNQKSARSSSLTSPFDNVSNTYDLPVVSRFCERNAWTRYVPICPTFQGWKFF